MSQPINYRLQRTPAFFVFLLLLLLTIPHPSNGEVGTSTQYDPPYTPTACYGNDPGQFPSSYLFAAAGVGIWENGAACGRRYWVRCISAVEKGICVPGQVIKVIILDYAPDHTTMALSVTAFGSIAKNTVKSINIEFKEV